MLDSFTSVLVYYTAAAASPDSGLPFPPPQAPLSPGPLTPLSFPSLRMLSRLEWFGLRSCDMSRQFLRNDRCNTY